MCLWSGGRRIVHRADLYSAFGMVDRWAGLAHRRQIYCFSPFLSVLSLFKVLNYGRIFVRHTTRLGYFLGFSSTSKAVAAVLHRVR